jgi:hypothetical protein
MKKIKTMLLREAIPSMRNTLVLLLYRVVFHESMMRRLHNNTDQGRYIPVRSKGEGGWVQSYCNVLKHQNVARRF